ncbi:MAG: hypothetical protein HY292_03225 [Planctomycetes bacterium]|nr:hypothetical protein [Planctomycetota bacterium]
MVSSSSRLLVPLVVGSLAIAPAIADTIRVSVSSTGQEANAQSSTNAISANGRYVVFSSGATNLVALDSNGAIGDVFVHDLQSGETELIDVDSSGTQPALGAGGKLAISDDGRFVAFASVSDELSPGDTNGDVDVFIRDRQSGITERVSVSSTGVGGNAASTVSSVSADGRYVLFQSVASNLVPTLYNGLTNIFVRDRLDGTTTQVSVAPNGDGGDAASYASSMTADGRYVAFVSNSGNLVPNDTNGTSDVFVRDRLSGITERVSVSTFSAQAEYGAGGSTTGITGDGRFVVFESTSTSLVASDNNGRTQDIFIRDRATNETKIASVGSSGVQPDQTCDSPSIAAGGRFVIFRTQATNLVPGDTNGSFDIFVVDLAVGSTSRVSVDSDGREANDHSAQASISADGSQVAFWSHATNLVANDRNSAADVFVHTADRCDQGDVNEGRGSIADVVFVNGSRGDGDRIVEVPIRSSISVWFGVSPAGPSPARYALWVWSAPPTNPSEFTANRTRIGCTVNPTPFQPFDSPQPFRCLRGGLSGAFCGGLIEVRNAPRNAPWTVSLPQGFARAVTLTLQGILEDSGAGNPVGFSVTNAVVVNVR